MLSIDAAISWAERRLGLRENPRYDRGDALAAVHDVALDIGARIPHIQPVTYPVTTVAGQGEYTIPVRHAVVLSIQWPADWSNPEPAYATLQQIGVARSEDDPALTRPTQWGWWWAPDGTGVLTIERAANIPAGLTVTLSLFVYEDWRDATDLAPGTDVALHDTLGMVLRNGLAWQLAQVYAAAEADRWEARYMQAIETWKAGYVLPHTMPMTTERKPY